jgi:hypothetical protein
MENNKYVYRSCKYILMSNLQFQLIVERKLINFNFYIKIVYMDRLCGLVVRVLGYRFGGPGSIPGTNRKKKI